MHKATFINVLLVNSIPLISNNLYSMQTACNDFRSNKNDIVQLISTDVSINN